MPIYEYRCAACGRRSSALLPRFDSEDPPCPHCGRLKLGRQVSVFATLGREDADDNLDSGGDGDWDGGGDDYAGGGGDFSGGGGDDDW